MSTLQHREARQAHSLTARLGTIRFFHNHRWLLHARKTRAVARRELRTAYVWVPILRRELARTQAALHPRPAMPTVDSCLRTLIGRESGWNVHATNPTTGAYGLPQALPGNKMASAGPDWATNPATQIRWMLGYVRQYGGSCGALVFQEAHGWY